MKVLFVASECAPFVKTGGLADVVGAVPRALGALGEDVRILMPLYPALAERVSRARTVLRFDDLLGGPARLRAVTSDGLRLYLLDAPHLYDRPGNIYLDEDGKDWSDNHLRFGALNIAAARIAAEGANRWRPEVVHAHDWQAGLAPLLIQLKGMHAPPATVTTIHNIAFQGLFPWETRYLFDVPDHLFTPDTTEYWGKFSFLKAGLVFADRITTVSPTYARELLTHAFGMGMEGVLAARGADFSGIVNGIDTEQWNPATDTALAANYTSRSLDRRRTNRAAIRARFTLADMPDAPLFCVISRLTGQKGMDLLLEAIDDLVARGGQLAVLGSGERSLEQGFLAASQRHPGSVGAEIGYDEPLSHLMQGGSDAILVPSRFEPCGLTQLYGLRYGTLPVVARTGGLADTVTDADADAIRQRRANGVTFAPDDGDALRRAIHRCIDLFEDRPTWRGLMRNAMRTPVSWDRSAPLYRALYQSITGNKA